jgi:hypothetical protein
VSADNWARCPKCTKQREDVLNAQGAVLTDLYGKVSAGEFLAASEAANQAEADFLLWKDSSEARTFREDYEICGAAEGALSISYSGGCKTCNLQHSFTHEQVFYPERAR